MSRPPHGELTTVLRGEFDLVELWNFLHHFTVDTLEGEATAYSIRIEQKDTEKRVESRELISCTAA